MHVDLKNLACKSHQTFGFTAVKYNYNKSGSNKYYFIAALNFIEMLCYCNALLFNAIN